MAALNKRINKLLRRKQRLLVHFNTPMSQHQLGYPHDLRDAIAHPHWALCLSTIKAADLPPLQFDRPEMAPVQGHVGVVMGVEGGRVISARASDQGSMGRLHVPNSRARVAECRKALADKIATDEWFAEKLRPLAIFTFLQPWVFVPGNGEFPITINQVIADFPNCQVISAAYGKFWLLNRAKGAFEPAPYGALPLR
jgi:hypothetical protein